MRISTPNENGVLESGHREVIASHGRSYAAIDFALCEAGLYHYGLHLMYSYGGFCGPIRSEANGCATLADARTAALDELLRQFPTAWPSDPASVHEELRNLREQVESHLRQPSLF
jgi:hypothetical protein